MVTIHEGDVMDGLAAMADESVHCVVTSPPYWGLRDYGVDGQIGLESTPEEYVARMVAVFREVRRVLRSDGVAWVNIGDSYASAWACDRRNVIGNGSLEHGKREDRPNRLVGCLKEKDLVGIPWRLAFALQADGWWLRSDCIWAKPNPMPESVTDRPTKAHEYVFLLTKSARYWWDQDAVAERGSSEAGSRAGYSGYSERAEAMGREASGNEKAGAVAFNSGTRNIRTVWTIATDPTRDAHFATFPRKLVERCIKAGCPVGGIVLDPFLGSGTTAQVAIELGRSAVGCELNPKYVEIARRRFDRSVPLFTAQQP